MKEISKELLSLVLGEDATATKVIKDNMLLYSDVVKNPTINLNHVLNLDTLGRLCKEWCWEQGYQLKSSYKSIVFDSEPFCEVINTTPRFNKAQDEIFYMLVTNTDGGTELEAIIKATEWVAKEKGLI